ncbi:MAG: cytochrome c [Bacteroidetes bacterium]|nr:MAG: cytochrome c [Bacteroidota bacterium]
MKNIKLLVISFCVAFLVHACSPAEGEFPGSEYMPDMGHSLALEANTYNYYYYNTWDQESTIPLAELVKRPDLPVPGTVARGYAASALGAAADLEVQLGNDGLNSIRITPNGSVPYYYKDTEEDRARATAEIVDNPFPITADGLARGKHLYGLFCATCHGEKANGLGYLYDTEQNPKAKYPAAPANLINEEFSAASNGRFYHAIIYGKNVMGGYADKLSYEERWQVIHYIRSLQAKEAGAVYNEEENTFNMAFGVPAAQLVQTAMLSADQAEDVDHHDDIHDANGMHQSDDHHHEGGGH